MKPVTWNLHILVDAIVFNTGVVNQRVNVDGEAGWVGCSQLRQAWFLYWKDRNGVNGQNELNVELGAR